ncbi:glycosyltransferase [Phaeocystidibacter marisrubri]|uniref:Glycosyltransferase n=1 Tax=Phaeocystidibacter marisrubri TaxID=1577780 RepID=A0A6L3ZL44_9FLAO|nr:glycosyltransferase [Phaeocystidibacter marisrubri]KAB2817860.1 glycosyltransferase [Phaeocystidibacter marisrubri]
MKELLILCNKFPFPPRDGSSIAMASNIRGLLSAGAKLTVIALNTDKHYVENPESQVPEGIEWHIHPVNTTPSILGALSNLCFSSRSYMVSRFDIEEVREMVKRAIKKREYDAAIVDGLFMMPYADELKSAGIPIVLRAHNVEHHIWNRQIQQETSPLKKWYLNIQNTRLEKYEVAACGQSDSIVAITQEDAKWFAKCSTPVHVMPCGIQPNSYPEYGSKEPDVFHIGAMDWIPNVDGIRWFAQKVWPEILKRDAQAVFHLAGRDSDTLNLHQPQRGFFVEGRVESASDFYAKHGIFVVPLLAGSGMRIKVMEALAYGKAIVGTRVAVEGIPIENGVHAYIADRPEDFAIAVIKLIQDAGERERLGHEARKLAMRIFDENKLAEDLLNRLPTRK